ncbi:DNA polymerase III subunit gamma and tau [Actinoplanes sp. NPDC023801]|uniref:DNA polymerase III subunit gamma and tau n=1 Tax=Actinoplanes sp. NPDC023801 TaxID=3154595 RepID=UPI0033D52500
MALALYRKYRPRTFAEVIGQEHVTEPLSQALRSGRLNHAYLFSGPRGCGKTSSARILARSLNCEQGPTPDPCGVCGSCKSLANDGGGSIDVIEIDAASHGGVDDARELREKAFFAPASSRFKIYVIDEAHMVSSAGFNALLKLVEEPPDYVKFIFATTEPDKVLGTIRSRTHHYPFRLIPPAVLRPYVQQLAESEGVTVEPSVYPLVVRAGGGSVRDSLSILDQLIAGSGPEGVTYSRAVGLLGVTDVTLIDEMCEAVANGDGAAAYATIDRVAEAGHEPRRFASDLLERFRDLIILQQVPDAVAKGLIDGPADQLETMAGQAHQLGAATLSRCADILHNGLVEMRGTTAPRLLLELVAARMLLPGADASTSALLQRLERLERGVTLAPVDAGQTHSPDVRGEHPPTDASPLTSRGDEGGLGAGPVGGGPVSGGPGGGGKAAAMAAAAAARAAAGSGRPGPGSSRPVSPAAPAAVAPAPGSSAPVSPAAPAAVVEASGSSAPVSSAGPPVPGSPGAAFAPVPGGVPSDVVTMAPTSSAGGTANSSGSVASGGPDAAATAPSGSRADGVVGPPVKASGSPVRQGGSEEPDWNRVADGGGSMPVDPGYYDEAPPWDEEPPEDEPPAPSRPQAETRPEIRLVERRPDPRPVAENRPEVRPVAENRPEVRPAEGHPTPRPAVESLAEARPVEVESRSEARPDDRLERVRTAWQVLGQQQPRVRAMQDYGIGVRDLEDDTIVFAAPTPALMERFLNWREAITTEFRKSPGGDWRIRCEVGTAGPAGPGDSREQPAGRDQSTGRRPAGGGAGRPAPQAGTAGGSARNTGRTESHPPRPQRAPAADADEDWPEPARPAVPGPAPAAGAVDGGSGWSGTARSAGPAPAAGPIDDASGWPEAAHSAGPAQANGDPRGAAGQPASSAVRDAREPDRPSRAENDWPEPVRPATGTGGPPRGRDGSSAAGSDDGWPEPVRPGGGAANADDGWPEPVRPGSGHGGRGVAGQSGVGGAGTEAQTAENSVWPEPARPGAGASATTPTAGTSASVGTFASAGTSASPGAVASAGAEASAGPTPAAGTPAPAAPGMPAALGGGSALGGAAATAPRGAAPAAPARSAAAEAARAAARTGVEGSSGAAAARAALANARSGVAARPAGGPAAGRGAAAPGGSARSFSDAPPVEEAPYDPEYDGPPTAYEGFDPGDEPLDDVIDEKTARQSGEEQAMQLLRAAFGAEKIGEL